MNFGTLLSGIQDWINNVPVNLGGTAAGAIGAIENPGQIPFAVGNAVGNTVGYIANQIKQGKFTLLGIDPVQILLGAILLIGVLSLVFGDKTGNTIISTATKAAAAA